MPKVHIGVPVSQPAGAIANALNRYGSWSSVARSAAIFAVAHGSSIILLNAFLIDILTGALFGRTHLLCRGVVTHPVYNGIWLLIYSLQYNGCPAPEVSQHGVIAMGADMHGGDGPGTRGYGQ
jgi:hypothetical protein